jgi:hypothetical protein
MASLVELDSECKSATTTSPTSQTRHRLQAIALQVEVVFTHILHDKFKNLLRKHMNRDPAAWLDAEVVAKLQHVRLWGSGRDEVVEAVRMFSTKVLQVSQDGMRIRRIAKPSDANNSGKPADSTPRITVEKKNDANAGVCIPAYRIKGVYKSDPCAAAWSHGLENLQLYIIICASYHNSLLQPLIPISDKVLDDAFEVRALVFNQLCGVCSRSV